MKVSNRISANILAIGLIVTTSGALAAQDLGPFMPHDGAVLTKLGPMLMVPTPNPGSDSPE